METTNICYLFANISFSRRYSNSISNNWSTSSCSSSSMWTNKKGQFIYEIWIIFFIEKYERFQYAEKGIIAICHLQKPKRILVEKSWETYDQLRVPQSELEWEELCFVSNSSVGYLYSPKKLQFYLNKRERFTLENFTEQTKIFYDYFNDENYLNEIIQLMISEDETAFSRNRFSMFKVNQNWIYS